MQEMQETQVQYLGWEDQLQQPIPVFLPEKFHGQRRMASYSLWGHKQSDTTQRSNNNKKPHQLSIQVEITGIDITPGLLVESAVPESTKKFVSVLLSLEIILLPGLRDSLGYWVLVLLEASLFSQRSFKFLFLFCIVQSSFKMYP